MNQGFTQEGDAAWFFEEAVREMAQEIGGPA
jgi:hypothetical protein